MKILFVHKQILFPHDTGGKIRALNIVRHLAKWHDLTYLCNIRPGQEESAREMLDLGLRLEAIPKHDAPRLSPAFYRDLSRNLLSPHPFAVARNYDPELKRRATELARSERFDLAICDTVQMARHVAGLDVPTKVLFQHNVEAQILERHARASSGRLRSSYMAIQGRRMRRFESGCGGDFDAVVAISELDRQAFERDYGWSHVEAIETSVDLTYFRPAATPEVPGRVAFVGSMDWLPNEDGVRHFVRHSWPSIRHAVPEASFQVVGRNPPPAVVALSGRDGIEVVGTVPDVRPHLAEAAVTVVPLRVGGGTRLKIFEAMAMGKPVISTSIGAEGLPVEHGRHLILVDDPSEFAAAVTSLLADPGRRAALGRAALDLVAGRFGTESVARQFDRICRRAVEGHALRSIQR